MRSPALPLEVVEHILSYLPKSKFDLCSCALVNRVFHAASIRPLYQILTAHGCDDEGVPLLKRSLKLNANLVRVVKALILADEPGLGSSSGDFEFDLFEGLLKASKETLEELSVEGVTLHRVADVFALPNKLRLASFAHSTIVKPATASETPPPNSVKHLSLNSSYFSCASLPPQVFPSLLTASISQCGDEDSFFEANRFIISLPSTLKALRIFFDYHWQLYYEDEESIKPSRQEWEQAFARWTSLETFEVDLNNFCGDDDDAQDELRGGLLGMINSGQTFKNLTVFLSYLDWREPWAKTLSMWLKKPAIAPPCMAFVKQITAVAVEVRIPYMSKGFNTDNLESDFWMGDTSKEELRSGCREKEIELKYQEGARKYLIGMDPFWSNFMEGKRWIKNFNSFA